VVGGAGPALQWELTGGIVVDGVKDDIVWVPRGTVHHIRNVGSELSLRLAVAMPPAMHYFSAASSVASPTTARASGAPEAQRPALASGAVYRG
jgi:oxalate decarboxylase/phosphoglucose isomerase-like protein (cupin superfamily)